jgi:hypothetical protein
MWTKIFLLFFEPGFLHGSLPRSFTKFLSVDVSKSLTRVALFRAQVADLFVVPLFVRPTILLPMKFYNSLSASRDLGLIACKFTESYIGVLTVGQLHDFLIALEKSTPVSWLCPRLSSTKKRKL